MRLERSDENIRDFERKSQGISHYDPYEFVIKNNQQEKC